jgi:carbonic anhydrase
MNPLLDGVLRFKRLVYPDRAPLFRSLAKGQSPDVLFITCSDSRIDPTLITQSEPGDLFIVRNAGNIVPPWGSGDTGSAAAIEYAVDALHVKHVVVCGHAHCGAMAALFDDQALEPLPAVRSWLQFAEATRRTLRKSHADVSPEQRLRIAIEHNALHQLDNLRTHPAVAARVREGTLALHAWVYDIGPGSILTWDAADGAFRDVSGIEPTDETGKLPASA